MRGSLLASTSGRLFVSLSLAISLPAARSACETSAAALHEQHTRGAYNLTLISIFAREKHVLRPWVLHYLAEGVDHIVLIDNSAAEQPHPFKDESCELQPFIDAGVVTLVKNATRNQGALNTDRHRQ